MSNIKIKNNSILYYGNLAGYLCGEKAIIDPMFQTDEMKLFMTEKGLEMEWEPGTFERLITGTFDLEGNAQLLKKCRVWQIVPKADVMMKFISYDTYVKRFGEPKSDNYQVVFDGDVDTNELEGLYAKFNFNPPLNYKGHSLSISDVLELYDKNGCAFYYCDTFGFKEISFQAPPQGPEMKL